MDVGVDEGAGFGSIATASGIAASSVLSKRCKYPALFTRSVIPMLPLPSISDADFCTGSKLSWFFMFCAMRTSCVRPTRFAVSYRVAPYNDGVFAHRLSVMVHGSTCPVQIISGTLPS